MIKNLADTQLQLHQTFLFNKEAKFANSNSDGNYGSFMIILKRKHISSISEQAGKDE